MTDDSATSVLAMREAAHNILYMAGNSWMYENGTPQVGILAWQWVDYIVSGVIVVALVALEVIAVRRFLAARDA